MAMCEKKYLKEVIEEKSIYQYKNLDKVIAMGKDKAFYEIEKAGLTGRGGAGFNTAAKWKYSIDKENVVLICNGDEGEPGTFKDRYILENKPEIMIEGLLISAFILGAEEVYIYIRGEYIKAIEETKKALGKIDTLKKILNDATGKELEIKVITGAGAYVCGDETSLINSIEGKRPNSRVKPPFPAEKGLFGKPTVVNNVETLSNIPLIIRDGGDYYSTLGTESSRGTKLICLSGKVKNGGVYEVEFGKMTIRDIINKLGGGIKEERRIKFVIPGGISTAVLSEEELDTLYEYKAMIEKGTSIGSGAVIVADEDTDTVAMACNASDFFMGETCGICFPCKEGNRQIHHILEKIISGKGEERDLELIEEISNTTALSARCGLGQSSGNLILSTIKKLRGDYMKYIFLKGGK